MTTMLCHVRLCVLQATTVVIGQWGASYVCDRHNPDRLRLVPVVPKGLRPHFIIVPVSEVAE